MLYWFFKDTQPSAIVIDTPTKNHFSPNEPSEVDPEDDDDSECEFEDLDPLESPALQVGHDIKRSALHKTQTVVERCRDIETTTCKTTEVGRIIIVFSR